MLIYNDNIFTNPLQLNSGENKIKKEEKVKGIAKRVMKKIDDMNDTELLSKMLAIVILLAAIGLVILGISTP